MAVPVAPTSGLVRVVPLPGETTLSFMNRLAAAFQLSAAELLGCLVEFNRRPNLADVRKAGEVLLEADARALVCALSGVPQAHLYRALPAWEQQATRADCGQGGKAVGLRKPGAVLGTGPGCRLCVAQRLGRPGVARLYLPPHRRVCARHQQWLLCTTHGSDGDGPAQLGLRDVPEVASAQRRHGRLLQCVPQFAEAFAVAEAVVTAWWGEQWPEEETWPRRTRLMVGDEGETADGWRWRLLTRDAVTYPEAVTLAAMLADPVWQRQVAADAQRHLPHSLADVPTLLAELARRLHRPWLPEQVAGATAGPLNAWVRSCFRAHNGGRAAALSWRVAPAHRPRPVEQVLHEYARAGPSPTTDVREPRGVRAEHPYHGFERGLACARVYAAEHGHLCAPNTAHVDGVNVGLWLANQRAAGPGLSAERAAALAGLDPWWNPPWNLWWQRWYQRARTQAAGRPLVPERGFPGTHEDLGEWLYDQCTAFAGLHPQQQQLLAGLGITAERARAAKPRRRNLKAGLESALGHARAWAAEYGHLCAPTAARQDGYPIGVWLSNQRLRARHGDTYVQSVLEGIDPWWNPLWSIGWQRAYYSARAHARSGGSLDPATGFAGVEDRTGQWLFTQCVRYAGLHEEQQRLLAGIGITAESARTARPHPDTRRPGLETGLAFARSFAAEHGHLDVPRQGSHQGFPLNRWLQRQRHQAYVHARLFDTPWLAGSELEAIDPWWNPPWGAEWQRNYRIARAHADSGLGLIPEQGFPGTPDWRGQWLYGQCAAYSGLHPRQQQLLAEIGITAERAALARPRRVSQNSTFEAGLAHARAWAAQYGHLAARSQDTHDGYNLGHWLGEQRARADGGCLPLERAQALGAIDPWWNPLWGTVWQRAWHRVKQQTDTGIVLRADQGFPGIPAASAKWLVTQCARHGDLAAGQQQLLAALGITAQSAPTARPRPDAVPTTLDGGLVHARTWAGEHGHLAVAHGAWHDGFPLGKWLYEQRKRAVAHLRRTGRPWPHEALLAGLDPWWNPPWRASWQHSYTHLHTTHTHSRPLTATQRRWLATQHTNWTTLHPDQQQLLTNLGLTPDD